MEIKSEFNRIYKYFTFHTKHDDEEETILDLLLYLERYLNLSVIQMERIKSDEEEMLAANRRSLGDIEKVKAFTKHWGDIHFFINCVHKFLLIAFRLADKMEDEKLQNIVIEHKDLERKFSRLRNSFEHIDERLAEQEWFRKDTSCMINHTLVLRDDELVLTENSLIPLYTIFENIIARIDEILEPRKERIDQLWDAFYNTRPLTTKQPED